jgi:hypothetical protein
MCCIPLQKGILSKGLSFHPDPARIFIVKRSRFCHHQKKGEAPCFFRFWRVSPLRIGPRDMGSEGIIPVSLRQA